MSGSRTYNLVVVTGFKVANLPYRPSEEERDDDEEEVDEDSEEGGKNWESEKGDVHPGDNEEADGLRIWDTDRPFFFCLWVDGYHIASLSLIISPIGSPYAPDKHGNLRPVMARYSMAFLAKNPVARLKGSRKRRHVANFVLAIDKNTSCT